MEVESEKARTWLGEAIRTAFVQENVLFRDLTHERSIVFHVARHLASIVTMELPGYAVDVDYDRWHRDRLSYIKKRLYGLDASRERCEHDVYPDIIVHRRNESSAEANILVVEAKKLPGRHARDRRKLELYKEQLAYQHAVFVVLGDGVKHPTWDWISEPGTKTQPVF